MLEWDVALFFVAVALGGSSAFVTAVTGTRLATWLGRNSLLLYIWHFPVFVFVARHTVGDGWSWEARTVVALTATVVICVLADRLLERRVKEWLRRPAWRDLDDGVPHWLWLRWGSWSAELSTRLRSRTRTRNHRAP